MNFFLCYFFTVLALWYGLPIQYRLLKKLPYYSLSIRELCIDCGGMLVSMHGKFLKQDHHGLKELMVASVEANQELQLVNVNPLFIEWINI